MHAFDPSRMICKLANRAMSRYIGLLEMKAAVSLSTVRACAEHV